MNNKEIILQIFTGGYHHKETNFEEIKNKLEPILKRLPVKRVIAGWTIDEQLYRNLADYLHFYNVELFLWLPVFSETGAVEESKKIIDFRKQEIESFSFQEGENFEFYCPNIESNKQNVIKIYEDHFASVPFDGIFLDKIRYGAFSNGLSGVFSCFCPTCIEKYKENGLDTDLLIEEMEKVQNGLAGYDENALGITGYEDGMYEFKHPIWSEFFALKANMIYGSLIPICDYFKKKDLQIGLDTFSPFTAYFAGQNIPLLNELSDFIKPMMYRITKAPAGLPFEIDKVISETTKSPIARENMFHILNCVDEENSPFDIQFVKRELNGLVSKCKSVYCGIEINRIDEVAPTTPSYIEENLQQLGELEIKGFVLSWNLLSAPEENIEKVITYLGTRR